MSELHPHIVALISKIDDSSSLDRHSAACGLIRLMQAGGRHAGFWSAELLAPLSSESRAWTLIQRFNNAECAESWRRSEEYKRVFEEFKGAGALLSEELSEESRNPHGTVATAFATEVKPGSEEAYLAWEYKIQTAQVRYPGYKGFYWQPPSPGLPYQWHALIRFDSPEQLENWLNSEERKRLIAEQEALVNQTKVQRLTTSFPAWAPLDVPSGEQPPNWKTAILVLLGLYPIVMVELHFLTPHLKSLNSSALSSFINMLGSVSFTSWISMPFLIRKFKWWLFADKKTLVSTNLKGCAIVVLIFAMEIALLWNLPPYMNAHL